MKNKYLKYINKNLPRIEGKTVVITGGTGGIGFHITKYLAYLGAKVILAARNKDKTIDIYIKESTQRLLIKIENTCKDNLYFEESLYGVGIRSVIATTTKYEGMYDFSADDGIFYVKISLNFK